MRRRLWLGAGGVALFIAIVLSGSPWVRRSAPAGHVIGLDFMAFYAAGSLVRDGRAGDLYDIPAITRVEDRIAARDGVPLGSRYGPWWNPPFYALLFEPFSRLSFPFAADLWIGVNLLCIALSCVLLVRMLPDDTPAATWALAPVLIALSMPFLLTVTHGQNTGTSLLILTATVALWRSGRAGSPRAFAAGAIGGLLFFKPQLAAVMAAVMILDLGPAALLGFGLTGGILLGLTLQTLPGALSEFLHRLPANIRFCQTQAPYGWERHATFKAFWRLLLQGHAIEPTSAIVTALGAACSLAIGVLLLRALFGGKRTTAARRTRRDRLIAATIVATPLLMPFYFDYDLLLISIAMVLLAGELLRGGRIPATDRPLIAWISLLYVWLLINPDIADATRINLAVPLLAAIAIPLILRVNRSDSDIDPSRILLKPA